jgi:hypothetical protein
MGVAGGFWGPRGRAPGLVGTRGPASSPAQRTPRSAMGESYLRPLSVQPPTVPVSASSPKGALMEREPLDEQEAFTHLRRRPSPRDESCPRWPPRSPPANPSYAGDPRRRRPSSPKAQLGPPNQTPEASGSLDGRGRLFSPSLQGDGPYQLSLLLPSTRRQAARDGAERTGRPGTAQAIDRPFVHVTGDDRGQAGMGGDPRGAGGATCKIAGIAYTGSNPVPAT